MGRPSRSKKHAGRTRAALSREKLIEVALELLDANGAEAVTMRALAEAAGVTAMALYNHFSCKRDLLAAVADHVISAAAFDGQHVDWRDQVRHCFRVLRDLCLRHPGLPALLEIEGAAPPNVFAPMEVTLRALAAAGLSELDGMRTYYLLVGYTLSQASYQTRGPIAGLERSEMVRAARIAERNHVASAPKGAPDAWDFDASFSFGLSLVLSGVEATVTERAALRRRRRRTRVT